MLFKHWFWFAILASILVLAMFAGRGILQQRSSDVAYQALSDCGVEVKDPEDCQMSNGMSIPHNLRGLDFKGVDSCKVLAELRPGFCGEIGWLSFYRSGVYSRLSRNSAIPTFPRCEFLWVGEINGEVVQIPRLDFVPTLRELRLVTCELEQSALADLEGMELLYYVSLHGVQNVGEILNSLGTKELISLALLECEVPVDFLARIDDADSLEFLDVRFSSISDAHLELLGKYKHLKRLNLTGTDVTDASVKLISECDSMQMLILSGTGISQSGLEVLSKELPESKILF
ncbi:hypothetical protein FYK55_25720 [Roseiconus nitratireducens]|uniref:Leucine Rich repeats (2 copies) n=1 Tax=Roseiconus nitratireducens TaxID=2605748 RepID=A0A5M6CUS6_9BACT|nr:hypothetical protein [Roseiconus nitratireducens]KAA5538998.1 hypothetical protein FYK55_25720 [Roseiconus nitratireducens]